jgi:RNA polymerase sigma factor (sigma-70 family)
VTSTLAAVDPTNSADARFEQFYVASWRQAVRWATALTGSRSAGEDLAQDAFSRVGERFRSLTNPTGYLRAVIVNGAHDLHRARQRRARRESRDAPGEPAVDPPPFDTQLLRALARLPYEQRAVLVLRYWADWTESDIADALGCRPATVRSYAKRGLDTLRGSITEEHRS